MKKIIKIVLLVLWLLVIYFFSSQNGVSSGNLSNGLLKEIASFFGVSNIEHFVETYGVLIRKFAHFIEYLILGVLVYINVETKDNKKTILLTIILCLLYATSDELHQLFVNGRVFMFTDIIIDSLGSTSGCFIIHLINICFLEKKH